MTTLATMSNAELLDAIDQAHETQRNAYNDVIATDYDDDYRAIWSEAVDNYDNLLAELNARQVDYTTLSQVSKGRYRATFGSAA